MGKIIKNNSNHREMPYKPTEHATGCTVMFNGKTICNKLDRYQSLSGKFCHLLDNHDFEAYTVLKEYYCTQCPDVHSVNVYDLTKHFKAHGAHTKSVRKIQLGQNGWKETNQPYLKVTSPSIIVADFESLYRKYQASLEQNAVNHVVTIPLPKQQELPASTQLESREDTASFIPDEELFGTYCNPDE